MTPNDISNCIVALCAASGVLCICLTVLEVVKVWAHRELPVRKFDLQALQDGQSELFARWEALRGQSFAPLTKFNEIREEVSELRHLMLKRTDSLDERTDKQERAVVRTVEEFNALKIEWVQEKNKLAGLQAPRR